MNTPTPQEELPIRVRIPADLDTPDQLVAGLSVHQVSVLAAVALPLYGVWQALKDRVPLPVLSAPLFLIGALAVLITLGRRDGVGLDAWLLSAITHRLRPRRTLPSPGGGTPPPPSWSPPEHQPRRGGRPGPGRVGVLRLPGEAISADGVITTGPSTSTVLVAASTVSTALNTPAEQAGLLAGYARWLHSLTGPVQVVLSTRRVDLGARALHVAEAAHHLTHPALARAALEHAEHLLDLGENTERLTRTVTIACTAPTTPGHRPLETSSPARGSAPASGLAAGTEAGRRAARTAAALSALGARCKVLDGALASAVLTCAIDPFGPGDQGWARTPPAGTVTTAHSNRRSHAEEWSGEQPPALGQGTWPRPETAWQARTPGAGSAKPGRYAPSWDAGGDAAGWNEDRYAGGDDPGADAGRRGWWQ